MFFFFYMINSITLLKKPHHNTYITYWMSCKGISVNHMMQINILKIHIKLRSEMYHMSDAI